MASRKLPPSLPSAPSSWMDLLAQATLKDAHAGVIHAEITGDVPEMKPMRLVVQSFQAGQARPVGSTQRSVTAEELRNGVQVRLVELRADNVSLQPSRVVAWVEPGRPDLELDARRAQPSRDAWVGEARGADVEIHVTRRGSRAA